jgi:ABC-type transport system involved in cytochrome c biogenesis permease component
MRSPFRSWESSTHPVARRQRLEVLMGFTGFFAVVAFGSAVAAELRGGAALVEVLVLLFFLAVLGLTYRSWRRIQL